MSYTRKLAFSVMMSALGVVLSPMYIPMGPTKAYPFQHMINAITGVALGPWWAALVATLTGVIRNLLGVGTIFAFPGGIPGALVVGFTYKLIKRDVAALSEPLGTSLGAVISATIVAPAYGKAMPSVLGITNQALLFILFWLVSCVPGSLIGYIVIKLLKARGILKPELAEA